MSKLIKFTPELKEKMKLEFEAALSNAKMVGGEFSFKHTLPSVAAKAVVRFTPQTYLKMMQLVRGFDKEVAWHCVADRGEKENEYILSDVLVYPQTVSAATVEMDPTEYSKWVEEGIRAEDERFFRLHAQGHSHVNMAVSPSGTDLEHQKGILADLRPTGFYIFMIWNKRNEHTVWVYDLGKNIVFEDKDIDVWIGETANEYGDFLCEAKKIVKSPVYQPLTSHVGWNQTPSLVKPVTQVTTEKPAAPAPAEKKAEKPAAKKEKIKAKVAAAPVYSSPYRNYNGFFYDDDYDDPNSPFYVRDSFWH